MESRPDAALPSAPLVAPAGAGPERLPAPVDDYEIALRQLPQWQIVWRRFMRHRLAVWSLRFLLLIVLLAIIGPWIAPPFPGYNPATQNLLTQYAHSPSLHPFDLRHLMGSDAQNVPIATWLFLGAKPTLTIGILGSLLAAIIGALVGGVSGYFGRAVDALLMRVADAFLTVPFLPFLMVLSIFLRDRGMLMYVLLFGLTGWAGMARLTRSSFLSLREREYAEAARALGAGDVGIILRHLLPNMLDVLIVASTLNVAVFILAEASLDFVGAGTSDVTWGKGMAAGGTILGLYWWVYAFPGVAMLLTVLSVNFVGDGLRDALDNASAGLGAARAGEETDGWVLRGLLRTGRGVGLGRQWLRGLAARPLRAARPRLTRMANAMPRVTPVRIGTARRDRVLGRKAVALQSLPVPLLFLVGGILFLYGHSPLRYSPYYAAPVTQATIAGESDYGAVAQPDGGWALGFVDGRSRVVFARTQGNGAILHERVVDPAGSGTAQPSLAMHGASGLIAWVNGNNDRIMAAHVGARSSVAFTLNWFGTQVAHPYAVARADGGYDVLFQLGTGRGAIYDIYRAVIPASGRGLRSVQRLTHAHDYAIYPRGIDDGGGALNVLYMDRTQPGIWAWTLLRVDGAGRFLGKPRVLDHVQYYSLLPNGAINGNAIPDEWGIDLKGALDGSVWAVWDGDDGGRLAHWSAGGRMLLPPTTIAAGTEGPTDIHALRTLGLAVTRDSEIVYHNLPGEQEPYMAGFRFDRNGTPIGAGPDRLNYDGGGESVAAHADTVRGHPVVIWQKIRLGNSYLESSTSHPFQAPDLLTRLGLNIGTFWSNVLVIAAGALALGAGIAIINVLLAVAIALLLPLVSRLVSRRLAWPIYTLLVGGVLVWLFARATNPPPVVIVISGLNPPYGLIAALGGGFLAWWAGRLYFARQDAFFRAVSMSLTGIYFVAVMYAVIYIEGQVGRI